MVLYQEPEDEWREDVCHQHHGEHSGDGHLCEGMECRVACHDQGTDADEHDQGGDDDGVLVGSQHLAAVGILVHCPFRHEDGVVVALAEDEGGEDDVDDVELHSAQCHDAQYPQPAHRHRHEREGGQLDAAERQPEEEEHDESAGEADVVEVVGEVVGDSAVHARHVKAVAALCVQGFLHSLDVLVLHRQHVDDMILSVATVCTEMGGEERFHERVEVADVVWAVTLVEQGVEIVEGVFCESLRLHVDAQGGLEFLLVAVHKLLPSLQPVALLRRGGDELRAGGIVVDVSLPGHLLQEGLQFLALVKCPVHGGV